MSGKNDLADKKKTVNIINFKWLTENYVYREYEIEREIKSFSIKIQTLP